MLSVRGTGVKKKAALRCPAVGNQPVLKDQDKPVARRQPVAVYWVLLER